MGYLVKEVVDPELSKEELDELIAFITRLGRVSKLTSYLHLEGEGKENIVEEEMETKIQKQTREAKEKKRNDIFKAAIQKSHLVLIEKLSKTLAQVPILGLLLTSE